MDFNSIKPGKAGNAGLPGIKEIASKDIAIIGMACVFPSACNAEAFWMNIRAGMDCITAFPAGRKRDADDFPGFTGHRDREYAQGAYLDEVDKFDYAFFRISPTEGSLMSPCQRMFLETALKSIEDAGYGGGKLAGSRTGVYIGYEADAPYDYKRFIEELDPLSIPLAVPGNLTPIIASRISYLLDLRGPSMSIDTACSASLVAVHTACRAIRNSECDMALAGSVRINLLPLQGQLKLGIESADGRTRAFDDSSDGTGSGEGVAAVVLKPLSAAIMDRDHVYAVIKGSAVNQDGRSIGITAPNVLAQEDVIVRAWKDAEIDPVTISYIEAHGTGTKLGDPVEIDGIRRAFGRYTDKKRFCAIGSVKTNIGHLDNAAGIAGLIKAVMALKHGELPPSLHFRTPNRQINFNESPVYVNTGLRKWETQGFPRRCGISSFGFSGTNCHLILEEAPVKEEAVSAVNAKLHILALSAKSANSLELLLAEYGRFTGKEQDLLPSDICYTANTGRGHYGYRLAFIFRSMEELKAGIDSVNLPGLKNIKGRGIYYGCHKLVPAVKEDRQQDEITDSELGAMDSRARKELDNFLMSEKRDEAALERIAGLYVRGAGIEFEKLYSGERNRKVSLPVYPFESNRCWVKAPAVQARKNSKATGALIDRCLLQSMHLAVYSRELDPARDWILAEHRIAGKCTLVGTAYLEMVQEVFPGSKIGLKDIVFIAPLTVEVGERREVQLIINRENAGYGFSVVSRCTTAEGEDAGTWSEHIQGRIYNAPDEAGKRLSIAEIKKTCNASHITPDLGAYNAATVFTLGPHWDSIREIYVGGNELLSYIELKAAFTNEVQDYVLHPALLDNALTAAPLLQKLSNGNPGADIFLPFSYGTIKTYKALPSTFYSYVKTAGSIAEKAEMAAFDIVLLDAAGAVLVEIGNYTLKRVHGAKLPAGGQDQKGYGFYNTSWVKQGRDCPAGRSTGSILVLGGTGGFGRELAARLKKENSPVIEAYPGAGFEKTGADRYTISCNAEDYKRLLVHTGGKNITKIIHAMTVTDTGGVNDIAALDRSQLLGVQSLFYLVKALQDRGVKDNIDIVLISRYVNEVTAAEEMIRPEQAALFGLARVIPVENPHLNCRCIDMDAGTGPEEIIKELGEAAKPYTAAYRCGERYMEELGAVNPDSMEASGIGIKASGVYLITGGTGGIGLEIAKHMSLQGKVNLALVSRTGMPAQEEWDRFAGQGNAEKTGKKLRAVREMERAGAHVVCYSADVSDWEQMQGVVKELREKYGRINGVIHSAGEAGDGFLTRKEERVFNSVLAPKVRGTWILDQLTAQDKPDFFVMFSSATILKGVPGQGDYTAANAYQNSYAAYRQRQSRGITLTVNWAGWKETGMAFDRGVNSDGMFKALTTRAALTAYNAVMAKNAGRIIIGEINYNNNLLYEEQPLAVAVSREIRDELEKHKRELKRKQGREAVEIVLKGRGNGEYTKTERLLAGIYGEVLGIREISIYDDFYSLGGDSLIGMRIINAINHGINAKTDIAGLFENITVKEFAEYIDKRAATADSGGNAQGAIERIAEREYYPLSAAQNRMFVLHNLESAPEIYNISVFLGIEGKLDKLKFEAIFKKIIVRHDSLRTSFEIKNGTPVQIIHDHVDFNIGYFNENDEDKIKNILSDFVKPFDITKAPLLRIGLIETNSDKYILMCDMHHIISDGTSMSILSSDFLKLYNGEEPGALPVTYKDFTSWQNDFLKSDVIKKQEEYWLHEFKDMPPALNFPADFPRTAYMGIKGDIVTAELDAAMTKKLNAFSNDNGVTLFMTLLAALNVILAKYTGTGDVTVGTPIAGRRHADVKDIIGVFLNTLALRNKPGNDKSFTQFLDEVKAGTINAFDNQDYQFEMLLDKLNVKRDPSRSPLFDVLINLLPGGNAKDTKGALKITPYDFNNYLPHFDLTLYIINQDNTDQDKRLRLLCVYRVDLFKKERIKKFLEQYACLLEQIMSNPGEKMENYSLVTAADKALVPDPRAAIPEPQYELITGAFDSIAKHLPEKAAVSSGKKSYSYSELEASAKRIAGLLLKQGAQKGKAAAVYGLRSYGNIASALGVFFSGCVLVNIDRNLPDNRKKAILKEAEAEFILYADYGEAADKWLGDFDCQKVIRIDPDNAKIMNIADIAYEKTDLPELTYNDAAYIFFTSGTTGTPKGVLGNHKGLAHFLAWQRNTFKIGINDRCAQLTSFSFDVVLRDVFTPLTSGATLVLPEAEDYSSIIRWLDKEKISVLHTVPSLMQAWLNSGSYKDVRLNNLRFIFFAGEPLKDTLVAKLHKIFPGTYQIINLYGPAETTLAKCFYLVPENSFPGIQPIGKALPETQVLILKNRSHLCGINETGEIAIRTPFRTFGYINSSVEDRNRFAKNPFNDTDDENDIVYYSGDQGYYGTDGNVHIIGRVDNQVKIHGIRIEPGEIENQLLKNQAVKEAVVTAIEEAGGEKKLCAYIVTDNETDAAVLRESLSKELPEYMLPSCFVKLEKLPLTANGKVDRKALPGPEVNPAAGAVYEKPGDELERNLVKIWQDLLGLERIGTNDNFFELGGNSLNGMIMLSRIYKEMNVEIPLHELFMHSSVKKLGDYIRKAEIRKYSSIEPAAEKEYYRLSSAQKRMYVMNQFIENKIAYNVSKIIMIEGNPDLQKVKQIFLDLMDRHESLRTSFEVLDNEVIQRIHKKVHFEMDYKNLEAALAFSTETEAGSVVGKAIEKFILPFDLSQAPLFRVMLIKLPGDKHLLLFDIHHIISDGVSIIIIINEFINLYNCGILPPLRIQYKDYAGWQNAMSQSGDFKAKEEFWLEMYSGDIPILNLPTDYSRPFIKSYAGDYVYIVINSALKQEINELIFKTGTTMFMVLISAYYILLAKYTGQEDLVIGSSITGRSHADLENVVGMFVNMLALRNKPGANRTYMEFLDDVKGNALKAFANQEYQFEMLVNKLDLQKDFNRNPLFDTVFNMQNMDLTIKEMNNIKFMPYTGYDHCISRFDLLVDVYDVDERIELKIEYSKALFKKPTIAKLGSSFVAVLEQITRNPGVMIGDIAVSNKVLTADSSMILDKDDEFVF